MRALLAIVCLATATLGAGREIEHAQKLYDHADFAGTVARLAPMTSKDANVTALLGQSYFMLGEYKKATDCFERAVAQNSSQASYYHWLGRAYGKRAETSFAISAIGYASKARINLEKAIELDPTNLEAINDLFEFYLQAPGIIGGGFDKAAKLAHKIAQVDPIEGHFARARLAEEGKEYDKAEAHLRRAVEMAPRQVGRVLDLAKFLATRGRYEESDKVFRQAEQVAPDAPKVLFARADTYIKSKRNLETARELLQRYLAADITPDDPSKLEAQKLLKQVTGG